MFDVSEGLFAILYIIFAITTLVCYWLLFLYADIEFDTIK